MARTARALPEPERGLDPRLRRLIWILILGGLAPLLDSTVVNVALATLGRDLQASVSGIQWVVTAYLLALGMAIPVTGWATDRFGAKRLWLLSLGLFLVASILSGASWNLPSLIAFRILQGAAGGVMQPVMMTILIRAAGERRLGLLMATASLPIVVVPIFGPVVGGLIVANLSWRWIFYVNLPICLAGLWLAWRGVPEDSPAAHRQRLDGLGLSLICPAMALILYGLSQASGAQGFLTGPVLAPAGIGLLLAAAFTVHALRSTRTPLVNLRIFRVRSLSAACGVLFLAGLSLYGPLVLLALYYQQVRGQSALWAGLLLAPQGVGSLLPRIWVGKLTDRIGPKPIVVAGLLVTAVGTLAFAAGPQTNELLLAVSLVVRGAGLGSATIAVMAGAFRSVLHEEVADASSATRIVQQVGGSFGTAVLALILGRTIAALGTLAPATWGPAFGTAFWWAVGFALLAIGPALVLPSVGRRTAVSPADSPAA